MMNISKTEYRNFNLTYGTAGKIEVFMSLNFNQKKKQWVKSYVTYSFIKNTGERFAPPDSATRSPSALGNYLAKHPEWGKIDANYIKHILDSTIENINNMFNSQLKKEAEQTLHHAFEKELKELLNKYKAKIVGTCGAHYEEASGWVSVDFENIDTDFDLLDLESDKISEFK